MQKKQNNFSQILPLKKAGLIACLFLCSLSSSATTDLVWQFDPQLQEAYVLVTNLQSEKANELLKKIKTNELHKLYVQNLSETIHILITEDHNRFIEVEQLFKERIKYLESLPVGPETLFLQAELNLQRGFCLLNLGQDLNSVIAIRKAYQLASECLKKYPSFLPIKKTSGVIQVMIGSVPDKYNWFVSLLGMKGSVITGQKQLTELQKSKSSLSMEANILLFTIKGFINQQFSEASEGIIACLKDQPENRLLLFIGVNMLMKDARSEEALQLVSQIDRQKSGLPMHYIDYLRAEILLQKGHYQEAIQSYQSFIKNYPSQSFKKDSYFKIAMCYWLLNDVKAAQAHIEKAKITGTDKAEPDKYAARQLAYTTFPNKKLLKVRYSTDGGYYKQASELLATIVPADLPTAKDQTEYYYRKARLADRTGEIKAAQLFYQQSIDMTKANPWYFGANAALHLGYIAKDQKDYTSAKKYFELALSFPRHEYKNSIDSKARSELEQLAVLRVNGS